MEVLDLDPPKEVVPYPLNFVFEPQFVLIVPLTVVFFFSKHRDLLPVVLEALVLLVPLWVVLVLLALLVLLLVYLVVVFYCVTTPQPVCLHYRLSTYKFQLCLRINSPQVPNPKVW